VLWLQARDKLTASDVVNTQTGKSERSSVRLLLQQQQDRAAAAAWQQEEASISRAASSSARDRGSNGSA
jgi:hypothetical protein